MVLICNWCWQRQADKGQCEGVCESSFWESKVRDPVVFMLCDNVYGLAILQGANIKEQTKMNTSQANMKPPQMTKKWWITRKGSGPGREVLIISLEWWQTFHSHWLRPQSWKWKRIVRLTAFFGRSTLDTKLVNVIRSGSRETCRRCKRRYQEDWCGCRVELIYCASMYIHVQNAMRGGKGPALVLGVGPLDKYIRTEAIKRLSSHCLMSCHGDIYKITWLFFSYCNRSQHVVRPKRYYLCFKNSTSLSWLGKSQRKNLTAWDRNKCLERKGIRIW